MSKYFFFKTNWEPSVIGVKDGTSQALITDNELERIPWLNELMWWSGRERPINIHEFHMNLFEGEIRFQVKKKAKLTDVIRYAPPIDGAMIISNRLKQVLEKFNIGKVHFKNVLLLDTAGEILSEDYCLIQVPFLDTNQIDWKNTFFSDSVFDGSGFSPDNEIGYYFNNIDEFMETNTIGLDCRYVSLETDLDLINTIFSDYIVSERLKVALEEHQFTSVVIEEPWHFNLEARKHVSKR